MNGAGPLRSRHRLYPAGLLLLYLAVWTWLAFDPVNRDAWLLENILVFALVPFAVWRHLHTPFSHLACTALFVFLVCHAVGSHYTYAHVPYDLWCRNYLGFSPDQSFDFTRNHYDRLVHFLFGLLVIPAVSEITTRHVTARGLWRAAVPVSFLVVMAVSYEMLEWWAAELFGGDLGIAFLAAQGDPWDGHKDVLLAATGALLASTILHKRRLPLPPAPG